MELNKRKYELSIWNDIITNDADNSYFSEEKVATIGGHDMITPIKAYNVILKENVNGEKTLSFSMISKYYNDKNELVDNPFISMLDNERKIKLRLDDAYEFNTFNDLEEEDIDERWTDYVIKNKTENSSTFTCEFLAKEIYINELNKNGNHIVLNTDLENNYGTLPELGQAILDGSDWIVGNGYSPTEKIKEPLFIGEVTIPFMAKNIITNEEKEISGFIYPFYTSVEWIDNTWKLKNGEIQFLYNNGSPFSVEQADDNLIIIDNNFTFNMITENATEIYPITLTGTNGDNAFNGNKVVKTQDYQFEQHANQFVNKYKVINDKAGAPIDSEVFGFTETEYVTGESAKNYLTNFTNFTSNLGWTPSTLQTKIFPEPGKNIDEWIKKPSFNYLKIPSNTLVENSGPTDSRMTITKGDILVFRTKLRYIKTGAVDYGTNGANIGTNVSGQLLIEVLEKTGEKYTRVVTPQLAGVNSVNLNKDINDLPNLGYPKSVSDRSKRIRYTSGSETTTKLDEQGYFYRYLIAETTTRASTDKLVLKLTTSQNGAYDCCIEDVQLFHYKEDNDKIPIFYGDEITAAVNTNYRYYNIENDEINYLSSNSDYYEKIYKDNYQSIRNIDIKESTYFNSIQTLAEKFEVWVKFKIYHKKNGEVLLIDGNPKKEIIFSQFAPNGETPNSAGFKYGINLNNTKRTVNSDAIVSKTIVKNNSQEFAIDGSCSIVRANDNPSGENTILNFDYYINQQILSYNQVLKDLYGTTLDDFAYYTKIKKMNNNYLIESEKLNSYKLELEILNKQIDMYNNAIESAQSEIDYYYTLMKAYNSADNNYIKAKEAYALVYNQKTFYIKERDLTQSRINYYTTNKETSQVLIDTILEDKKNLNLLFYKKYSRFIQEGIWNDDNYIDDNLYFLDASSISDVSAFPKVTYEIGVIDIGSIEKYKGYSFKIGQTTFIEDPTFFGYINKIIPDFGSIKTPYQMEVIVTERTTNLDDPSKSTIKIQNFKNQFEEIFSKINSTSQQLQLESGGYGRAAASIAPNGEIVETTLEKSFANNSFILSNSNNQNVIIDTDSGIEITNNENTNEKIRIVAGGVFLSVDGGDTWLNAITGRGINTQYLLAGQIDVSKINLVQGEVPYFRWDTSGISAFYVNSDDGTYNIDRFVRYSQHGLYGTKTGTVLNQALEDATTYDEQIKAIKKNSTFALTWEGFGISGTDGAVSLDPNHGLELFSQKKFTEEILNNYLFVYNPDQEKYTTEDLIPLVSIGKYFNTGAIGEEAKYGLRMRNQSGYITLDTDINGNLWLRDKIAVGQDFLYGQNNPTSTVGLNGSVIDEAIFNSTIKTQLAQSNIIVNNPIKGEYNPDETDAEFLERYGSFLQNYSLRMWAGGDYFTIEQSPFYVLESGLVYARDGIFNGAIYADTGRFSGKVFVGNGEKHGISGAGDGNENGTTRADEEVNPVFWSGRQEITRLYTYFDWEAYKTSTKTYKEFCDEILINFETLKEINASFFSTRPNATENIQIRAYLKPPSGEEKPVDFPPLPDADQDIAGYTLYHNQGGYTNDYNFYVDQEGLLFAKNAEFDGKLTVQSGSIHEIFIPDESSGISSNLQTRIWINAPIEQDDEGQDFYNRANSAFSVDDVGNIYATTIFLKDSIYINPQDNYYTTGINDPSSQMAMWSGAINENYNESVFSVDYDGNVIATSLNLKDGLLQVNNAQLTGVLNILDSSLLNGIYINSEIGMGTLLFNDLQGWKIDSDGNAFFNNISLRGELKNVVFSNESKNLMGGSLLISPTYYDNDNLANISIVNINVSNIDYKIYLEVDENIYNQLYWENNSDIILNFSIRGLKTSGEEITSEFNGVNTKLIKTIENDKFVFTFNFTISKDDILWGLNTEQLLPGMSFASLSNNSIQLNAVSDNGPSITIDGPSLIGRKIITQLGRLDSTLSTDFNIEGYGLYSENVFLNGKIYLPNAGVTNEDTLATPELAEKVSEDFIDRRIRFWAGASANEKEKAPFLVTQDGRLFATSGEFRGTVVAENSEFSGYLKTTGILIDPDNPTTEKDESGVFYVAYDRREKPNFPEVIDTILKIDKYGLSIWEGGLSAYSDYASGWKENPSVDNLYGYGGTVAKESPYPYLTLIDDDRMRLVTTTAHIGRVTEQSNDTLLMESVKIDQAKISFLSNISNITNDFSRIEKETFSSQSIWDIYTENNILKINKNNNKNIEISSKDETKVKMSLEGDIELNGDISISNNMFISDSTIVKPYVGKHKYDNGINIVIKEEQ